MKKLLVLLVALLLVTSCTTKTEKNNEVKIKIKEVKTKKVEQKFGDLTKYIKVDITDDESKKLSSILEQRKERQAEVKKMIEKATKENKDKVYTSIVEKRKICANRISIYVSEKNISKFKKYCEKVNIQIKKKLDNK